MKICVFGAGAIGGHVAAELALSGAAEVSVIARGPHLEAIRKNGLTLVSGGETRTAQVAASDDPAAFGPQDAVIIGLKAHQAWESAEAMAPLLGPETAAVTCQNGVPWWYFYSLPGPHADKRLESVDPGGRQWRAIGPERAVGCVVFTAAEITEPGVINHTYGSKYALGEPDGAESARVKQLSAALEASNLQAPVLPNIRDEIWLKLWGNLCFNPISALTRATLDIVATDPGTYALSRAMMEEAEVVARKFGADFRVDIERRISRAAKVGAHRTSMLQDLEKGRALEIDALVTAVQEMGRMAGVETPAIDAVLALVQQLGRTQGLYPVFPGAA